MRRANISTRYGLTAERLARAAPDAVVMHPGPMNRGVEIDGALADDPDRSLITLQVEMGVAVRMACLEMLRRAALSARRTGPARRRRNCGRSSCRRGSCSGWQRASASRWLPKPVIDRRQKVPLGESKRARIGR